MLKLFTTATRKLRASMLLLFLCCVQLLVDIVKTGIATILGCLCTVLIILLMETCISAMKVAGYLAEADKTSNTFGLDHVNSAAREDTVTVRLSTALSSNTKLSVSAGL